MSWSLRKNQLVISGKRLNNSCLYKRLATDYLFGIWSWKTAITGTNLNEWSSSDESNKLDTKLKFEKMIYDMLQHATRFVEYWLPLGVWTSICRVQVESK